MTKETVEKIAGNVFPIFASLVAERYKDALGTWLWVIFAASGIVLLYTWGIIGFLWELVSRKRRHKDAPTTEVAQKVEDTREPCIYVAEVLDESHLYVPVSPIVLHNRGDDVAHAVQILPVPIGYREVSFDYIDSIGVGEKKKALPRIKNKDGTESTLIFYALKKELEAMNTIQPTASESIQLPLTIIYKNRAQTHHFETIAELSYFPIRREISGEFKQRKFDDWPHDTYPWYEVRHNGFKKT